MKYAWALILLLNLNTLAFGYTAVTNQTDSAKDRILKIFSNAENLNPNNAPMAIYSLTDENVSEDEVVSLIQNELVENSKKPKKFFLVVETSTLVWSKVSVKKITQNIDSEHVKLDIEYLQFVEIEPTEDTSEEDSIQDELKTKLASEEPNYKSVKTQAKNVSLNKFRLVVVK
jgi:hypothetical protein